MAIEEDEGQWLQAKARQLKERALGTADRTRRKQFLLLATEYQKLAQQEDGGIALNIVGRAVRPESGRAAVGVVTRLRVAPRQISPAYSGDLPAGRLARVRSALRRPEIIDLTIWGVLALIAFALLLTPGDQTAQGLREAIELLID